MDIATDLAAIQRRIAEITGMDTAPAVVSPAPAASFTAPMGFGQYLNQLMSAAPSATPAAPMHMPVQGQITSPFGERDNPMGEGTEFHPGIDIAAEMGTPIEAAMGGQVVGVSRDGGYGNLVTVDDGNGLTTRYAHCSQIFAKVGETVLPGDVLGTVGMTGRATGPHLHFEVRQNDTPVDPLPYLGR